MTAALAMPALSDDEDGPPNLPPRLRIMPNDNETTETLAPPTDREAPTNPDNPKPAPRLAVNPPNPYAQKPDWWEGSFFQSVFNDVQAARRANESVVESQEKILEAVLAADRNSNRNYELIRDEIRHLKDSDLKQDQRLKEGDKRFELIEAKLTEIEERLVAKLEERMNEAIKPIADELEAVRALLAELKTHGPRTSEAPST